MEIKLINPEITLPKRGSEHAAGFDIFMPEPGRMEPDGARHIKLGFATTIPVGYAAQLMPRSSAGANGLVLVNTIGLIDADYRGEWMAIIHNRSDHNFEWAKDDRLLQFILVPVITPDLVVVFNLPTTDRGEGGFGSTNK